MKLVNLHIFLENHEETTYEAFKEACVSFKDHGVTEISVSPMRDYGEFGEIYVTLQMDETKLTELLNYMSDGWDGPEDDCMTTSFTANVFHDSINTIYFTMYD